MGTLILACDWLRLAMDLLQTCSLNASALIRLYKHRIKEASAPLTFLYSSFDVYFKQGTAIHRDQ